MDRWSDLRCEVGVMDGFEIALVVGANIVAWGLVIYQRRRDKSLYK